MSKLQFLKANVETIREMAEELQKAADTKENAARLDGEINAYTNVLSMINEYLVEENKQQIGGEKLNPVLVILIILAAIILWFLLSFIFFPFGKFISRIGEDAMEEMNKDKNDKKEKN